MVQQRPYNNNDLGMQGSVGFLLKSGIHQLWRHICYALKMINLFYKFRFHLINHLLLSSTRTKQHIASTFILKIHLIIVSKIMLK